MWHKFKSKCVSVSKTHQRFSGPACAIAKKYNKFFDVLKLRVVRVVHSPSGPDQVLGWLYSLFASHIYVFSIQTTPGTGQFKHIILWGLGSHHTDALRTHTHAQTRYIYIYVCVYTNIYVCQNIVNQAFPTSQDFGLAPCIAQHSHLFTMSKMPRNCNTTFGVHLSTGMVATQLLMQRSNQFACTHMCIQKVKLNVYKQKAKLYRHLQARAA